MVAITAVWLIPAIVTAGAGKVAYALVGYWIPFTQYRYSGGAAGATLLDLLLAAVALALLLVGACLCRRHRAAAGHSGSGRGPPSLSPRMARQPYPHYLVPSITPTVLALSSLPLRSPVGAALSRRLAGAGLVAATLLAAVGAPGRPDLDVLDGHPQRP